MPAPGGGDRQAERRVVELASRGEGVEGRELRPARRERSAARQSPARGPVSASWSRWRSRWTCARPARRGSPSRSALSGRVAVAALDDARTAGVRAGRQQLATQRRAGWSQVIVSVELGSDWFRIGVQDSGSGAVIAARTPDLETGGGFGLISCRCSASAGASSASPEAAPRSGRSSHARARTGRRGISRLAGGLTWPSTAGSHSSAPSSPGSSACRRPRGGSGCWKRRARGWSTSRPASRLRRCGRSTTERHTLAAKPRRRERSTPGL